MLPIGLTLQVEKAPSLTLGLDNTDLDLSIGTAINVTQLEGDKYEGPYSVTPKADAVQTLYTRAKTMEDDVTVLAIPYYQTSNTYGDTIYIGSEVELNGN
jgi:hypothetical protein